MISHGAGAFGIGRFGKKYPLAFPAGQAFPIRPASLDCAMVKETKFFRSRPTRLNAWRGQPQTPKISQSLLNMAKAYRSQADALKAKRKIRQAPATPKRPALGNDRRISLHGVFFTGQLVDVI
jgi:hypothetical protein